MTDILNTCPRCGMQAGQCVHMTEGQVSIPTRPEPAVAAVAAVTCVAAAARGGADLKLLAHAMRLFIRASDKRICALLAVIKTPALDCGYRQRDSADRTIAPLEAARSELLAAIERCEKAP